MWIQPRQSVYYLWMFDKSNSNQNGDYLLGVDGDRFRFQTRNLSNVVLSASRIVVGEKYHIARVVDLEENRAMHYVDGRLEGTVPLLGLAVENNSDLRIGRRDIPNEFLLGSLDELRIWGIARGVEGIRAGMNQWLTGIEDGLVAYWRFDEGEGEFRFFVQPTTMYDRRATGKRSF